MINLFRKCALICVAIFFCMVCASSCADSDEITRLVVWVSNREFARYAEMFNATRSKVKVILVYKENPAAELPPRRGETPPDIIAGQWLRTENTTRSFRNLGNVFDADFSAESFYQQLLEAGQVNGRQYLLPLSFNIPAVIFAQENQELLADSYTISADGIREASCAFNEKNKTDTQFTKIGFALLNNEEFLYLAAKIMDAQFRGSKASAAWNEQGVSKAVSYLHNWLETENGGAQVESNFAYKYLSMPAHRQVATGRCLFAYIRSDDLFSLPPDQTAGIDYRWITKDGNLPIDDAVAMIGISSSSKHVAQAKEFIKWLLSVETQRAIIENKIKAKLDTDMFGIAGGFSSLWQVNEQILPAYYTMLMSNIPPRELLEVPYGLPPLWDTIKERVVIPYFIQACGADSFSYVMPLQERLSSWERQNFN